MIVLSFIVIMLSGFIQGTTSFGFSLIALPLLGRTVKSIGLFIPINLAVTNFLTYILTPPCFFDNIA
jgi:uncharacterized membrane protein YfcA